MPEIQSKTTHVPEAAKVASSTGGLSWRAVVWAVVIAALIFLASSRSRVASPGVTQIDDKFAHFAVYGLLGTLVCRIKGGRSALLALLIASVYGASDEWHQSFVPGRSSDVADWIADTLGAALAITLYARWSWYRELLERSLWRRQRRIENS